MLTSNPEEDTSFKYTYVDLETDGLLKQLTKIHVIGCLCLVTKKIRQFTKDGVFGTETFEDFKRDLLPRVEKWVAHNGISFDFPILTRFFGVPFNEKNILIDTLVLSRLVDFRRPGGHSLKNLAKLAGSHKGDYTGGWEEINEDMVVYNKQDLVSGDAVLSFLRKEYRAPSLKILTFENEMQLFCNEITNNGFYFDIDKAKALTTTLAQERDKLATTIELSYPQMPKVRKDPTTFKKKKDGSTAKKVLKTFCDIYPYDVTIEVEGDYTLIDWVPFNPSSRQQIIWQLRHKGWQPIDFSDKGAPKVDEDVLVTLSTTFKDVKDIIEYLVISKRLSQIESWLECYDEKTHRIHGTITGVGTRTHRGSHATPNQGQVPGVRLNDNDAPLMGLAGTYNFECRDCWSVPEGYSLVGVDASAIQLVVLAHCVDDPALTFAIENGKKSNGTDIHSFNRRIIREAVTDILECSFEETAWFTRAMAKTFIYAFLLGAGAAKLAAICGIPQQKGALLKELYLKRLPKLADYLAALREEVFFTKSIKSIDGRLYTCDNAHFALAFILQGYEALFMKKAGLYFREWLRNTKEMDAKVVAWVHDEYQIEVKKGYEKIVIDKLVELIEYVGKELNLKCKLTGSGDYGSSWSTSH